ncbi:MAG TPA: FtsX-like permease family protein [Burkholderiales bacterium]|nr:FtsX-like permease family protein [Burkholderiales bacterium]
MSRYAVRRNLLLAPLAQHKGRLALSVLAIALGVALGYAVRLINQAALNEFAAAVQTLSGEADLAVRGPRAGFEESLYPRLAKLPEVAVASPVLEVDAKLVGGREPLKILGLDIFRAARIQSFLAGVEISDRLDFLRPDRIFLSAGASESLGLKKGDALSVQVGLRVLSLQVAGVLGEARGQQFAIVDIGAAQAIFLRSGYLNRIDLRLRPGADPERVAGRLRAEIPPGTLIERPDADVERSGALSRAYRVNLNVLALVALFTGGLLVFSAQALAVVRRRAQLALLRVLGMTRKALVAMLLAEAAVIGAMGALAGIALGHAGAAFVLERFGAELGGGYFRGLEPTLALDWPALALFFSLGILAAVLGSLAPALEAAGAGLAPALKAGDEERALARLQPAWPGLAVLLAGAALTQAGPVRGLPLFGYGAIALLLIGTVMLMPRIAVLGFRVAPLLGQVSARIGLAQLRGAPGQAGVSLAAIVASVSLMVSMAIMVASFRQSLDEWLERMLPADLYLRAGPGSDTAFLSLADQRTIAALPGARRVEFLRSQRLIVAPDRPPLTLLARAVEAEGRVPPLLGAAHALKAGEPPAAWVSEVASDLYGWRPGAVIELPLGGRHARFTVAGIWRDYARQQGAVLIERYEYLRHTGDAYANDAALWLAPGADPASLTREIQARVAGGVNLEIAGPGEIREGSLRVFDRTFAVTYALEAVAVVIGLFGLSSSFGALVLSRRREFGVLRHIGMTRRQIGAMLAAQGLLVSAVGLAVGLTLGWVISLVLIHVVNRHSFHWGMELHLPWRLLAEFVAVMLVLATLTAIASGRQAMSGDAVRAVKEDW